MLPELGSFAIILALCFVIIQSITPLFASFRLSKIAVVGQFIFLAIAMLCLVVSFLMNDMTVLYVREHSHQSLPLIYRIGAAWGGHEGSLLLWCLILSSWSLAFVLFNSIKTDRLFSYMIMVLGIISTGFILFLFFTSNPFLRDFPDFFITGEDLTPVLQDPGLIFHPPMLYSGYVGFAVGFAFAVAALIQGGFDKNWARAIQPWIIMPWALLSGGIVLGSWWAYRELGWGGWWFWDPVENASLLPWLSATALIHSLIVSEKRDAFKGWILLLAIITFGLSLIGTFLVRSGVLVSVHAFANDPARGIFLLSYLALIMGGALLLYIFRIKHFFQPPQFQLFSRETALLLNSIVLLTAVVTILLGTLYPIILDAMSGEKISVGEPYFNTVFVPLMLPFLLLMGFAPHVQWGKGNNKLWKKLQPTFWISLIIGTAMPVVCGFKFYWLTAAGVFAGTWIILATVRYTLQLQKFELKYAAMIVAHLGIAVIVLGVTLNKSYSEERQLRMYLGDTVMLAGYPFTFKSMDETSGSNYRSLAATFAVGENQLVAQQRIYTSHDQTLSKPGILVNPLRDLYLALGNGFSDGSWSVRIYYKPFVRWIWAGGFMLLAGGLLSLLAHLKKGK